MAGFLSETRPSVPSRTLSAKRNKHQSNYILAMLLISGATILLYLCINVGSYRWSLSGRETLRMSDRFSKYSGSKSTNDLGGSKAAVRSESFKTWKPLMKKLDSSKPDMRFGKISSTKASKYFKDELQCKHFATCSGCTLQSNFTNSLVMQRAKSFFKSKDVDFKIDKGNVTEWRTHVKLAVQPLSKWGGLKFGLYKEASHEVLPIPECKVHHPRINEAAELLRQACLDAGVKGYVEGTEGGRGGGRGTKPQGSLRYVQLSLERSTNKVQLVLVWNAEHIKEADQSLLRLVKRLREWGKSDRSAAEGGAGTGKRTDGGDLWHSVTVNFNPTRKNNIFNYQPSAWKTFFGADGVQEKVDAGVFTFPPQVFRQGNLEAFERYILPFVLAHVPVSARVAELYAGVGVVGVNVAARGPEVYCSDNNEYVDRVFEQGVDSLDEFYRDRVFFECLSAEEGISRGQCEGADVLILDPPRRGIADKEGSAGGTSVLDFLQDKHIYAPLGDLQRVIYISCGYDALEQDLQALLEGGHWKVRAARGVVLFPGTDHLETVVVLNRVKKGLGRRDSRSAAGIEETTDPRRYLEPFEDFRKGRARAREQNTAEQGRSRAGLDLQGDDQEDEEDDEFVLPGGFSFAREGEQ